MRTFGEIDAELMTASGNKDVAALLRLCAEMEELGTPQAEAAAHRGSGWAMQCRGDHSAALEHFERAYALYEALGNQAGIAHVMNGMGIVHRATGDSTRALEYYNRALAVHILLENKTEVATVTGNIGGLYANAGNYPAALEHFQRALAHHQASDERLGVAAALSNIGVVHQQTGNNQIALDYYHHSLALYHELHYRPGISQTMNNIGNVHLLMGNYSAALDHYNEALRLQDELGNASGVAYVTGNVIFAHMKLEQFGEAARLLDLQATMPLLDPGARAAHEAHRAILSVHNNDLTAAHGFYMRALAISDEAGLRDLSAEYNGELRDLAQQRNDFAAYIEHNNEYQRITEEIRGKETTQRLTMMEAERTMEAERRERDKERALLYGALPKTVAERMVRGETVSGDHFTHAAVLFADIAGFTSNSANLDASDVVTLLGQVFHEFDRICELHGVTKVKTIGDAYMCFKGDASAEENAQAVAHVALAIVRTTFTWPTGAPLSFRVGIHIGQATAGVIGTQRLQYDVWGDTVNVASRMESTGEPGRIHVTEAFAEGATPHTFAFTFIERGKIDIKGKGPMTTYWLELNHTP